MNLDLTKRLPKGVLIGYRFYPVNTGHKTWIKIAEILERGNRLSYSDMAEIFSLCYKTLPENAFEAIMGVADFFSGGVKETKRGGKNKQKCFSFTKDGWLIYAAFLSQYGIDLLKEEIHWHKFLTLFKALSKEHKLFDVIFYRTVNLADIKDKEKRAYIRRMKSIFSLEAKKEDSEIAEEIAALF